MERTHKGFASRARTGTYSRPAPTFSRPSRPSFGRGNFRRAPAKKGMGKYINPELFVKKAEVTKLTVDTFVPEHKFSDFAIDERLKKNIMARGYNLPTPIQDKSIPHVLNGED